MSAWSSINLSAAISVFHNGSNMDVILPTRVYHGSHYGKRYFFSLVVVIDTYSLDSNLTLIAPGFVKGKTKE